MRPTHDTYSELDRAYDFFNEQLFGSTLPPCLITMQRRKKVYGYFWASTWIDATGKTKTDEIALNPDHIRDRSAPEVWSTLVHEMCHLQQYHFGKPSRSGYHNAEWAKMMAAVGLIASNTGQPGGKQTGQQMTHYIETGGVFDRACAVLIERGFIIPWLALTQSDEAIVKKKAASKTKYTCPSCGVNAWAKPEVVLICGECSQALEAEG